jgi:hypothetical protein
VAVCQDGQPLAGGLGGLVGVKMFDKEAAS